MDFQVPRLPATDEFLYPHPTSVNYMVLPTNFNIKACNNKRIPYPRAIEPQKLWMDAECISTSHAEVPHSPDDFALIGDMPDDMRSSLERNIRNAFGVEGGDSLIETNSSSTPGGHKFPAIHFAYYAQHAKRGDNAPPNIHPELLRQDGVARPTQFLHQLVPRVSKEVMENKREYKNICKMFSNLFAWIEAQLLECHPDVYKELSIFTDVLPGKDVSPVHPFGGFVVNLNVVTWTHRDASAPKPKQPNSKPPSSSAPKSKKKNQIDNNTSISVADLKKFKELQAKINASNAKAKAALQAKGDEIIRKQNAALLDAEEQAAGSGDSGNDSPTPARKKPRADNTLNEDEADFNMLLGPPKGEDSDNPDGSTGGDGGDQDSQDEEGQDGDDDEGVDIDLDEGDTGNGMQTEDVEDVKPCPSKQSCSGASSASGPKVKQEDFSPCSRQLANVGKSIVREQITLVDGFPKTKDTFIWDSIKLAAKGNDALEGAVNIAQRSKFTHGAVDMKNQVVTDKTPLSHPIIVDLIRAQFFSGKGKADIQTYNTLMKMKKISEPIMVENTLREYLTGEFVPLNFSEEVMGFNIHAFFRYMHHQKMLNKLKTESLSWTEQKIKAMFQDIVNGTNHSTADNDNSDEDFSDVDFGELEQSVKTIKHSSHYHLSSFLFKINCPVIV
ncbi:hypothetical protein BJV74DRAFT_798638 [Russula compacta]|nr:hypothetical protein BJV74DRAFT_798638 [Russula compacta]